MTAEDKHLLCQLAVIGAITYTGYSMYKLSASQEYLLDTAKDAMFAYANMTDQLSFSLEHLVEEKIG